MKKILNKIWVYIRPFLDWRFLISYFIPFMVINGWAWIGLALIPFMGMNWYTTAASVWMTILWMPWTPEKLVTIPAAIWIHAKLFGKNNKHLDRMYEEAKKDWKNIKRRFMKNKLIFIEITKDKKEHLCGLCGKDAKIKIKGHIDGVSIRGYTCEDCFEKMLKECLEK